VSVDARGLRKGLGGVVAVGSVGLGGDVGSSTKGFVSDDGGIELRAGFGGG
jgi:hypothetical protein